MKKIVNDNSFKKSIIIGWIFIAFILEILLVFSNKLGIKIVSVYAIYFQSVILFSLLFSLILIFFIKTKKEVVEIVKEKIVYKEVDVEEKNTSAIQNESDEKINIDDIIKEIIPDDKKNTEKLISNLSKKFDYVQALVYKKDKNNLFVPTVKYAYFAEEEPISFTEGQGLLGQTVKNKKQFILDDIPDDYLIILSGLGKGKPKEILMQPIISKNKETTGIIEIASFKKFNEIEKKVIEEITKIMN